MRLTQILDDVAVIDALLRAEGGHLKPGGLFFFFLLLGEIEEHYIKKKKVPFILGKPILLVKCEPLSEARGLLWVW